MSAYSTTIRDIANLGKPRAKQSVHRVTSTYSGDRNPRHVVLVIPDGQTHGDYYEVSDRAWNLLKSGSSPEYLGLEPYEPEDIE